LKQYKNIAFTHKTLGIDNIGKLHIEQEKLALRLNVLKSEMRIDEIVFLSTCNRVEFLLKSDENLDQAFVSSILQLSYPSIPANELRFIAECAELYEGEKAIKHILQVASSLDSVVVGEREIITQVRNAFENCRNLGLAGDYLRLAIKKTIETAKRIYTETEIANRPVSVVNLAYRMLRSYNISPESRILFVGAGKTNQAMARHLKKHGLNNIVVFNRTLSKGQELAADLQGKAYPLSELENYSKGFDVLITCTGSAEAIITKNIFHKLLNDENAHKIVIDLAVPADVEEQVVKDYKFHYISITELKEVASKNLKMREKEVAVCEKIINDSIQEFKLLHRERQVEIAMRNIPESVKEIKDKAIGEVFTKDLQKLDLPSREVLDKIIAYMEKKYISMPMKMAKKIMLEKQFE
jgi:glutamyl-tRNA reductase